MLTALNHPVRNLTSEFRSVAFDSGNSDQDSKRHYLEVLACQTEVPNDQNYLFLPESADSIIESYTKLLPVLINHYRYGQAGVGYGATVSARYESPNVYVTAYIMKDKQTPMGPYGDTGEMIEAIEDGALRYVSVAGEVVEGDCSICGLPYERRYRSYDESGDRCKHYRGGRYAVRQEDGTEVLETCVVRIKKFKGWELSFVWMGADEMAEVAASRLMVAMSGTPVDSEKRDALSLSSEGGRSVSNEVLQAEKRALETQLSAKDAEIATLQAEKTRLTGEVSAKNTEIAALKAEASEHAALIKDGQTARESAVEACVEAFTKTEPDTPESELKVLVEAEKASLESLSLDRIYKRTDGYEGYAAKLYPEGRSTKPGTETGSEQPASRRRSRRR